MANNYELFDAKWSQSSLQSNILMNKDATCQELDDQATYTSQADDLDSLDSKSMLRGHVCSSRRFFFWRRQMQLKDWCYSNPSEGYEMEEALAEIRRPGFGHANYLVVVCFASFCHFLR